MNTWSGPPERGGNVLQSAFILCLCVIGLLVAGLIGAK